MKKPLVTHHDSHLLPPITQTRHRHPSVRALPDHFKENAKLWQQGGCWDGNRKSRKGIGVNKVHEKWRADIDRMITDRLNACGSDVERTKPRSFAPWTANQIDSNKQTIKHHLPHYEPFSAEPQPESNSKPVIRQRMSIQESAQFKKGTQGSPQAITGELPYTALSSQCTRTTKLKGTPGRSGRSRSLHNGGCRVQMPKKWAGILSHPFQNLGRVKEGFFEGGDSINLSGTFSTIGRGSEKEIFISLQSYQDLMQ